MFGGLSVSVSSVFFIIIIIFTFLLSLLHHTKHFLLTCKEPMVRRSSCRCNDEAKPCICTAVSEAALACVRLADMVLLFFPLYPPSTLMSSSLIFNCT